MTLALASYRKCSTEYENFHCNITKNQNISKSTIMKVRSGFLTSDLDPI